MSVMPSGFLQEETPTTTSGLTYGFAVGAAIAAATQTLLLQRSALLTTSLLFEHAWI